MKVMKKDVLHDRYRKGQNRWEYNKLQYLEKIAEKGSINEAAKELYLSQPSLSNAVKELEHENGCSIIVAY